MADDNVIERVNAKLDAFERDTGIWPPGRSMPAAMCGADDELDIVRQKAWRYWQKSQAEIERLKWLEAIILADADRIRQQYISEDALHSLRRWLYYYEHDQQAAEGGQERTGRSACQFCNGTHGGTPGNENIIGGVVMCDYCHALFLQAAEAAEETTRG